MKRLLFGLALLTLAACESTTVSADDVHLATGRDAYVRSPAGVAEIDYAVVNESDRQALLPVCGETVLVGVERRVGGAWVEQGVYVCQTLAVYAPLLLEPGGGRVDARVPLQEPGRYRLVLHLIPPGDEEPGAVLRSAPFTIE